MNERMTYHNSHTSKVQNKLADVKHLISNEELYGDEYSCKANFLCIKIFQLQAENIKYDSQLISLMVDLVTLEAIHLGKQDETMEMVLQVEFL